MDSETLQKQIEKEIKKLNKNEIRHFAWLCAVRALPFIGIQGNFNFWNKESRQKHIYSIFYALDVNAALDTAVNEATEAGNSAIYATNLATAKANSNANFACLSIAAVAAYAAYVAAYEKNEDYGALYLTISLSAKAINTAAIATGERIDMGSILMQDLEEIKIKTGNKWKKTKKIYGVVWDNFLKALEEEDCSYWAKLYDRIFDNGFEIDPEALKRRMNVPKEVREQGASAVATFLEELEKGAKQFNETRIIILGEKGAGKTCLARRLINPNASMTTDRDSTAGVDTTLWKVEKENINLRIWDFAGHIVTHAVHQFFLSERCLYIIVYDGRTEERNRLEYWLNQMKNYGGESKAIIVVNKRDGHSVDIPIHSLKENYPILDYFDFSIKDDQKKLEIFRNRVTEYIKNNPTWNNQLIPGNYYRVKKALEDIFTKDTKDKCTDYITKNKFNRIAKENGIKKPEDLLRDLHFLGISLWYKDMEDLDTLVLNPEWISHGVYRIINWANEKKKYDLTYKDLADIFKDDEIRYPKDKHVFLYRLMIYYELAYETSEDQHLIIPHLLKIDRPAKLPDFLVDESLMLRYKAEQLLPPNTITRFIVRHNKEIRKEGNIYYVWRYGVLLENDKGSIALVREEGRTITLSVKGDNKTEYLSTLRETLNDIFNSYKSRKPELEYRVERFGQIPNDNELKNSLWLPDSEILAYTLDNVPYYDYRTRQNIQLQYTVNNYNITTQTLMSGPGAQFTDRSLHQALNFYDCNISLQGKLNDLAQLLMDKGTEEEAKELLNAANALKQAKQCKSKEEITQSGVAGRLKRLAENLGDKDSKLHRTVEGIKYGAGIAQDIAQGYNDIAQWLGLPQVPKPFLKKQGKN